MLEKGAPHRIRTRMKFVLKKRRNYSNIVIKRQHFGPKHRWHFMIRRHCHSAQCQPTISNTLIDRKLIEIEHEYFQAALPYRATSRDLEEKFLVDNRRRCIPVDLGLVLGLWLCVLGHIQRHFEVRVWITVLKNVIVQL